MRKIQSKLDQPAIVVDIDDLYEIDPVTGVVVWKKVSNTSEKG